MSDDGLPGLVRGSSGKHRGAIAAASRAVTIKGPAGNCYGSDKRPGRATERTVSNAIDLLTTNWAGADFNVDKQKFWCLEGLNRELTVLEVEDPISDKNRRW